MNVLGICAVCKSNVIFGRHHWIILQHPGKRAIYHMDCT